ncbi:MAG: FliG C-terminal domain-containing protein [Spirochaetales bacterium]|nr:FliG C-terminal domain-containing protein [Spirochaetales bacterium]
MIIPIIQIGNSKGIRLPQPVLKQCNATDKFELEIIDGSIKLTPLHKREYDLTFQNVEIMTDSEITTMLKNLDAFTIAVSLIDVDDRISDRIYKNLSKRAYELIQVEVHRLSQLTAKELIVEMHRAKINGILRDIELS